MESRGQGIDRFTGAVGLTDAVIVVPIDSHDADRADGESDSPSTMREYEALEIKEKLLDTLSVSGSVSIAGYGQQGDLMASYLNKESFEQASFTYLIRINVKHQPMGSSSYVFNPRPSILSNRTAAIKSYGDAYIKTAFSGWGVTGEISAEMQRGMSTLAKHSSIEISKMSLGQRKHRKPNVPRTTGDAIPSIIAMLKSEADEFYEDAVNHNSYLYALIDEYHTADGFNEYGRDLLDRYLEFRSVEDLIMRTPTTQFRGHKSTRRKLQNRCWASINRVHAWIKATDQDPSQGLEIPDDDPWEFRKEVVAKIVAPRMKLYNNGGRYYVWDQLTWQKKPHALWEIEVYATPVQGTVRLTCGESEEWAINRAKGNALCSLADPLPPGYITWFEAWVYNAEVGNVTGEAVVELARRPFDNAEDWRDLRELLMFL
ncbi:hypothetical protein CDD80_1207 [Ophiocordyceps camponoti-rufipedis]|uniref:Uncharacterized protein n=1 Tax=Ophiocordyceps camponoti-rufipedis TaxID=2004952 RepID=A0A2C5Z4Q0_9HYPO|nr:hypothetical protein CDD80_1207 [Ophiocordyceps camponoti-rufipedis]